MSKRIYIDDEETIHNIESTITQKEKDNQKESSLLGGFKKIMGFSPRITIPRMADMLEISQAELSRWLFQWSDHLSFLIEDESVIVPNLDRFTKEIAVTY